MSHSPVPSAAAFSREMAGRLEEIAPLTEALSDWAQGAGAPARTAAGMALMLDELITNIVTHGYGPAGGPVRVDAAVEPGRLVVTVIDRAFAFDPLMLPQADTSLGLEERDIGGLGVHFVRQMADELDYRRLHDAGGGANALRIVKRFG